MRPGLNVQLAPEPVARQLNVRSGALVLSVPGTSAAAKAGLKPTRRGLAGNIVLGDVIVAVGESLIMNSAELAKVLDGYQVGDQVVLKVQRDDSLVELPFTLEESVR
jgi:S1-C subfamily serine protease